MESRREFLKKAAFTSGGLGLMSFLHPSIQRALAIDPAPGSTFMDAEHIVFLMQENRSFDHMFGTLQGVRGYNDPRAIRQPNGNKVWLQSGGEGQVFGPFHLDIKKTRATWMHSLPHGWTDQVDALNLGKCDRWIPVKHSGTPEFASIPLTMGYHTRDDIPFYYALADAFTVCDQHFCSALTGTTPNRLHFWTGTILDRPSPSAKAHVWNEDTDYGAWASWTTFPERLEDLGIPWKIYQNELSVGVGFTEEEDAWLGNFTDNPLEFFSQFNVKFSREYIAHLPAAEKDLLQRIENATEKLKGLPAGSPEAATIQKELEELRSQLLLNRHDQEQYTTEAFEKLPDRTKNLHRKAFETNRKDPGYHQLSTLQYMHGEDRRTMQVPKGDVLFQFREDVRNNQLPTVSWLVAPENFSDHPSAAWYGAWYVSEAMDILTRNPEVWKKTIFILTYDENDGYFDHVPPFTAPFGPRSGLASPGIDTSLEFVRRAQQSSRPEDIREHSIGLGYRVPMVIASPWSRGGMVCSGVFDHTSSLMFLEKYLSAKTGKKVEEPNISAWRRAVCGDLRPAFRPWNGEKIELPVFVERDAFLKGIYEAQFRKLPDNFRPLTEEEIQQVNGVALNSPYLPLQEPGIRNSCALPYELYVDGQLSEDKKQFEIRFKAANEVFGKDTYGSPFSVYAPGTYRQEKTRTWAYAVSAGDSLQDSWQINDFLQGNYHLEVYGPNGFFREFGGDREDPALEIYCLYEKDPSNAGALSGKIKLQIKNQVGKALVVRIIDHAYKTPVVEQDMQADAERPGPHTILIDTAGSHGWYDFSVRIPGYEKFARRYAGRVETGKTGKTDPAMGQAV